MNKEFKNYAISLNITGLRLLHLLSILIESPKSFDEINNSFLKCKYLMSTISDDTLRHDLNALRAAGCDISRADKSTGYKYVLKKHPFTLNVSSNIINAIKNIYLRNVNDFSIKELLQFDDFFKCLATYCEYDKNRETLLGISILKYLDMEILSKLIVHVKMKQKIKFLYKIHKDKHLEMELLCDRFEIKNKKLYLLGYDFLHKNYSSLLVKNVKEIISFEDVKNKATKETFYTIYELNNVDSAKILLGSNDKIIKTLPDKLIVKTTMLNEFFLIQKMLAYGSNCKILEPAAFREKFIGKLLKMEEHYKDD